MSDILVAALADPATAFAWFCAVTIAVCRAVMRRVSRTARYTFWNSDPTHPTGQNRTDRAVNRVINLAATAALVAAIIIATGMTLGVW